VAVAVAHLGFDSEQEKESAFVVVVVATVASLEQVAGEAIASKDDFVVVEEWELHRPSRKRPVAKKKQSFVMFGSETRTVRKKKTH